MNRPLRQIPASIWALGFVSLLMDTSSELIHSLLPAFLVGSDQQRRQSGLLGSTLQILAQIPHLRRGIDVQRAE